MLLPLLYAILPGVLIGFIARGRITALANLRLRWIWLVIAGLVIQVLAMGYLARGWPVVVSWRPEIIVGTYVLVLAGLWRNWRVPGMAVVGLGFALNFAAILANGGQMPVTRQTIDASGQGWAIANTQDGQPIWQSKDVLLPRDQTRLWPLSDVIVTPPPLRRAASVGDLATYAGVALVIAFAMRSEPASVYVRF